MSKNARGSHRASLTTPLVSIVTPSYQQGRYIADTLASVALQDYPAIEHIVVDGMSTDSTLEALAPYRHRLHLIREPDGGQGDAINKGFAAAKGSILAWINSDDVLLPGAVRRAVDALQRTPTAAFVHGAGLAVDELGRPLGEHRAPKTGNARDLAEQDFVFQPTAFFTREAFERVGGLRTDLHWTLDWDLFLRLAEHGPIVALDPPALAAARFYDDCKTASGGWRRYREIVRLMRQHTGRLVNWASVLYGLELVDMVPRAWGARLGLKTRAIDVMMGGTRIAHTRARIVAQRLNTGLHHDRWVGRELRALVAAGDAPLLIEGVLPDWAPLRRQRLSVTVDGVLAHDAEVATGGFCLAVEAPGKDVSEVRVRAQRTFVPARARLTRGDHRRLAWIYRNVGRAERPERAPAAALGQRRLVNLHFRSFGNLGDRACTPLRWFEDLAAAQDVDLVDACLAGPVARRLAGETVVLGGGGLLMPLAWRSYVAPLLERGNRLIAWGIGHHHSALHLDVGESPDEWRSAAARYRQTYTLDQLWLAGVRDWGVGHRWVPDASCMSPAFDDPPAADRDVVVYEHADLAPIAVGGPRIGNGPETTFEDAIAFLASGRIVVTNSYHGVYWATLLGRRVVIWEPWCSKFELLRHAAPSGGPGDWERAAERAVRYPGALAECRAANEAFAADVFAHVSA